MGQIKRKYRTLFISDLHLGMKACQAELILDFLDSVKADEIYLVGDIIDFWRIRRRPQWTQQHNDVVRKILKRAGNGTKIFYVPGNHDEMLRDYCGMSFGGIQILQKAIHKTADGRKFLVIHGDEFDVVVRHAKWLALLGDWAYVSALWVNTYLNWIRRKLGFSYWSLSAYLKQRVKQAVNFIGEFETAIAHVAHKEKVDGVICGHIHQAAIKQIDDILYINTGDWVESCTAVVETHDGQFEIIYWADRKKPVEKEPPQLPSLRKAA